MAKNQPRIGLYARINGVLEPVAAFKHMTDHVFIEGHKKLAPQGSVYLVKCKDCGGTSFSDDGRFINEVSCVSCVQSYTELYFRSEYTLEELDSDVKIDTP